MILPEENKWAFFKTLAEQATTSISQQDASIYRRNSDSWADDNNPFKERSEKYDPGFDYYVIQEVEFSAPPLGEAIIYRITMYRCNIKMEQDVRAGYTQAEALPLAQRCNLGLPVLAVENRIDALNSAVFKYVEISKQETRRQFMLNYLTLGAANLVANRSMPQPHLEEHRHVLR
jgi:hypothetical protein